MAERSVKQAIRSIETREGAGFLVHRSFPGPTLDRFDPFLLLDEMGPMELGPGEAKGAPDHPHRGFETVTYMLSGRMEHRDSRGNRGQIGPGDVQWMTAGSGVLHSEMPDADLTARGGRMHGFQLWVNLPARDKMTTPRYQEIPAGRIPVVRTADGDVTVRVIAGEALGASAVIETRTPIVYLDCDLSAGANFRQPLSAEYNAFAYVVSGKGLFGPHRRPATANQMVVFRNDGDEIRLEASDEAPLRALLIAGIPLREPVARYGPFVMNTREEVIQAFEDYQSGRLGEIA